MAAEQLRASPAAPGPARTRIVLWCYAGMWLVTLVAASTMALAGPGVRSWLRRALGLTLSHAGAPHPSVRRVLALLAHNLPLAAWPLLLGLLGIEGSRRATRVASLLVGACALVNATLVGLALGACGTSLLPYLPQLPLEWAGLATGYASWPVQLQAGMSRRERARWLAVIASALTVAAALETVAVPHR